MWVNTYFLVKYIQMTPVDTVVGVFVRQNSLLPQKRKAEKLSPREL